MQSGCEQAVAPGFDVRPLFKEIAISGGGFGQGRNSITARSGHARWLPRYAIALVRIVAVMRTESARECARQIHATRHRYVGCFVYYNILAQNHLVKPALQI